MSKEFIFKPTGTPVQVNTHGEFTIPQKDINAFWDKHEITEEVRKKIKEAEAELLRDGYEFVKDRAIERKDVASLTLGTGNDKYRLTVFPKKTVTVVKTGESVEKYGVCKLQVSRKIPAILRREGEVVSKIEKECMALFKK